MICSNFCDEIYNECKSAEYAGQTIERIYKNGKKFCEAQNFEVIKSNAQCFTYDPDVFNKSAKNCCNILILIYFFLLFCNLK